MSISAAQLFGMWWLSVSGRRHRSFLFACLSGVYLTDSRLLWRHNSSEAGVLGQTPVFTGPRRDRRVEAFPRVRRDARRLAVDYPGEPCFLQRPATRFEVQFVCGERTDQEACRRTTQHRGLENSSKSRRGTPTCTIWAHRTTPMEIGSRPVWPT